MVSDEDAISSSTTHRGWTAEATSGKDRNHSTFLPRISFKGSKNPLRQPKICRYTHFFICHNSCTFHWYANAHFPNTTNLGPAFNQINNLALDSALNRVPEIPCKIWPRWMSLRGAEGDEAISSILLKTRNFKGMRLLRFARNDFFVWTWFVKETCET